MIDWRWPFSDFTPSSAKIIPPFKPAMFSSVVAGNCACDVDSRPLISLLVKNEQRETALSNYSLVYCLRLMRYIRQVLTTSGTKLYLEHLVPNFLALDG